MSRDETPKWVDSLARIADCCQWAVERTKVADAAVAADMATYDVEHPLFETADPTPTFDPMQIANAFLDRLANDTATRNQEAEDRHEQRVIAAEAREEERMRAHDEWLEQRFAELEARLTVLESRKRKTGEN